MNEDKQENGHHHDLKVDFDVLWKVRSLNRCVQPAQTEQLEETKGVEKASKDCFFVAGD